MKPQTQTNAERGNAPVPGAQRDMLEESEQRASEEQPKSFDERNLTDKVVEIGPKGPGKTPIKGFDPE